MEFACQVAGSKLIVVLGHTRCGAVKGACDHVEMGHLTGLLGKIGPAVYAVETAGGPRAGTEPFVEAGGRGEHAAADAGDSRSQPDLGASSRPAKIGLVSAMYSVASGEVAFHDELFAPAQAAEAVPATA